MKLSNDHLRFLLYGIVVLVFALVLLAGIEMNHQSTMVEGWHEVATDTPEAKNIFEDLRKKTNSSQPLIGTIENAANSGNFFHTWRLWIISLSQDQYSAFRETVIKQGGSEVSETQEQADYWAANFPSWWNPPKSEILILGNFNAIYDKDRQIMFLSRSIDK